MVNKLLLDSNKYLNEKINTYKDLQKGQKPYITAINCADSRMPITMLAEDELNHIFSIENIGNQMYTAPGSVDYGVLHLKTPLLVFVAHSDCGAVKAAIGDYSGLEPDIKTELKTIRDGISEIGVLDKSKDASDKDYLYLCTQANLDSQIKLATERYKELINKKELTVVGLFVDFGVDVPVSKITNINGTSNIEIIKSSYEFNNFIESFKNHKTSKVTH